MGTSRNRSPAAAASVQNSIQRGALPVTESRLRRAVDGGAGDGTAAGGAGAESWRRSGAPGGGLAANARRRKSAALAPANVTPESDTWNTGFPARQGAAGT